MAKINATTLSNKQLAVVYNMLSEIPVTRFSDKEAAARRVQKLLDKHEKTITDKSEGEHSVHIDENFWLTSREAPRLTPKGTTRNVRTIYSSEEIIEPNTTTNPKRSGSKAHARFALLLSAGRMTVGEYLDACFALEGGVKPAHKYRLDLTWDIEHGYIRFVSQDGE